MANSDVDEGTAGLEVLAGEEESQPSTQHQGM